MRRLFCLAALGLLLTSAAARAQLSTAQLSGRITDESGAVLPGVTVTAIQTDTGATRADVTDGNGTYVLPNLPTGPYRLEVSLAGFRTYVQTGIVLQVAATPAINAALSVGALEETVTVEGAAPFVDVQGSGVSEVVRNQEILALPLNGRNLPTSSRSSARRSGRAKPTAGACRAGSPTPWRVGSRSASRSCSTARCTTTRRTT